MRTKVDAGAPPERADRALSSDSVLPPPLSLDAADDVAQRRLVAQIERLREERRDLDPAIEALRGAGQADQLQLQRLKERKLLLRDKLARHDCYWLGD